MCSQAAKGLMGSVPARASLLGLVSLLGLTHLSCLQGHSQEAERQRLRQERRAYDGAPPIIPHAVAALAREDCLECHEQGLDLNEKGLASTTPHPQHINCQQCHLEQEPQIAEVVPNTFLGHRYALRGNRPYAGAPPTMPHASNMRTNCLGCHGERGGSPIRTPHSDRINCRQCHVAQIHVTTLSENFDGENDGD